MLTSIILGFGLAVGCGLWFTSRLWDRRQRSVPTRAPQAGPARSDTRPAAWFQLATYGGGRVAHLTPMKDGDHFEDENGECGCRPVAGDYRMDNGRRGLFFVHRLHRGVARQPPL